MRMWDVAITRVEVGSSLMELPPVSVQRANAITDVALHRKTISGIAFHKQKPRQNVWIIFMSNASISVLWYLIAKPLEAQVSLQ